MPPLISVASKLSQMWAIGTRAMGWCWAMGGEDAVISGAHVCSQPLGAELALGQREMYAGCAFAIQACTFDADGLCGVGWRRCQRLHMWMALDLNG